jgi:hypothetical protein
MARTDGGGGWGRWARDGLITHDDPESKDGDLWTDLRPSKFGATEISRDHNFHCSPMTSRNSAGLSPPPVLQPGSSSATNLQFPFPTTRPPLTRTPTRETRSKSANPLNGSTAPPKPDVINYDNFNDVMTQK